MMDAGRHPHIKLLTNSEVIDVKGNAGKFKVKVLRKARFIDEFECTACGECAAVCPSLTPNEFDEAWYCAEPYIRLLLRRFLQHTYGLMKIVWVQIRLPVENVLMSVRKTASISICRMKFLNWILVL